MILRADINKRLKLVDAATERVCKRLSRRAMRDVASGGDLSWLDEELMVALTRAMLGGHDAAMRDDVGALSMASDDLGALDDAQRKSLRKFYSSVARAATNKNMSAVRAKLVEDVRRVSSDKPQRGRRKTIQGVMRDAGVSREDPSLFKTMLRTHSAMAFNAATWARYHDDPDTWGFEYMTAGDDKVRHEHKELAGARYPIGHKFWDTYAPPNGWNCRCYLRRIKIGDKDARTKPIRRPPTVDPEFRYNAGKLVAAL